MAKAWKIEGLNYDEDLLSSLSKILKSRFNEMVSYEQGTITSDDIEYVHNMRVSSRRIQAVLKVFSKALPKKKFNAQYTVIKALKDYLGEVRHFDVFIDMLEKYRNELPDTEKKALNLMIIRQNSIRYIKRKEMVNAIKQLKKWNYTVNFLNFADNLKKDHEKVI